MPLVCIHTFETQSKASLSDSRFRRPERVSPFFQVGRLARHCIFQYHIFIIPGLAVFRNADGVHSRFGQAYAHAYRAFTVDGRKQRITSAVAYGKDFRFAVVVHPFHAVVRQVEFHRGFFRRHRHQLQLVMDATGFHASLACFRRNIKRQVRTTYRFLHFFGTHPHVKRLLFFQGCRLRKDCAARRNITLYTRTVG